MRWSWRKLHETVALGGATRKCSAAAASPVLDGKPDRLTRAVDRRPGDQRPYPGPGRLQRRPVDGAGAPLEAHRRRGEGGCGNPIDGNPGAFGPLDIDADHRAEAHPNADPFVVADAYPDVAADAYANR